MSNDKIKKLTKYVDSIKERLTAPLPTKHKNHPLQYKTYLRTELELTTIKIESLKLEGTK